MATENGRNMWFDKVAEFKAKTSGSFGVVPNFLLMYLTLGEDYASSMVKTISKGMSTKNGWNDSQIETFRSIRDRSLLQRILTKMEEKEFLLSRMEKVNGRKRKYFRLNPEVLRNPDGSEIYYRHQRRILTFFDEIFCCPKCGTKIPTKSATRDILEIPKESIRELTETLNERVVVMSGDTETKRDLSAYFKKWSRIERFDFVEFLMFIKEEALELNKNELAFMLDQYRFEIERTLKSRMQQDRLHHYFTGIPRR